MSEEESAMTDSEVNRIVSKILRERLKEFGFRGSNVRSEQDFDGSSILRVTAQFKAEEVPTDRLTEVLHEIRSKLLSKGEERFVFLSGEYPHDDLVDEDVE